MATTRSTIPAVYRLTFADWLQFPEDGRKYEIIGGELFVSPTPNIRHQRISQRLSVTLFQYLLQTGEGEVLTAPTGVQLSEQDVPEPDLLVVLTAHRDRIGVQVIEGPPDIVIEILSPGTAGRDLVLKRELYARSAIAEYWIVDPIEAEIQVLQLDQNQYVTAGRYRRDDVLQSPILPGLRMPLEQVISE